MYGGVQMRSTLFLVSVALVATVTVETEATTYVVRPDGTGDFPTIQAAIDAAADGDIIELANGTFTGAGNRGVDYLGKGITVRSVTGNPWQCIIDCESSARGFLFDNDEGVSSVLEGVTIANGIAPANPLGDHWGGGVFCSTHNPPGAIPVIRNCFFIDNHAETGGGGLYTSGDGGVIEDCVFEGNTAGDGGGLSCVEASIVLRDCIFIGNSGYYGGGIHTRLSAATIQSCTFEGNVAFTAGAYTSHSSLDLLTTCNFSDNSVTQTGGAIDLTECSGVIIKGCTFDSNTASSAGAVALSHGSPTIVSCTFYGNSADEGGSIVCGTAGHVQIVNTIICASLSGSAINCIDGSSASLECCNLFENAGGDWVGCVADQDSISGNFSASSIFCDPASDDYGLDIRSPCLTGNHPLGVDCGVIGAHGFGCDETAVELTSWGKVKSLYRN